MTADISHLAPVVPVVALFVIYVITCTQFLPMVRRINGPRRRDWRIRQFRPNARIHYAFEYGSEYDVRPGFVRCRASANGVTLYDFEVKPEVFVEWATDAEVYARNFR